MRKRRCAYPQCQVQPSNCQSQGRGKRHGGSACRHCAKWPQNITECKIRFYQYFICHHRLQCLLPSLIMTLFPLFCFLSLRPPIPLRHCDRPLAIHFVQAICANLTGLLVPYATHKDIYIYVCVCVCAWKVNSAKDCSVYLPGNYWG